MNQSAAPFFDRLAGLPDDAAVFSTPGHKGGRGSPAEVQALFADALLRDVPHGGGVDTTHISFGALRQAERLAAEAYEADLARFLVNGSTTGNLAMLLATCRDGDEVIVTRMLHKSLLAGLVLSGARPVYVAPELDPRHNLPLDTTPEAIQSALEAHPRAVAVVLVNPSYVGVSSDLTAIAAICHAAGVPLLVDEAWGPHFPFHPNLPPSAMQSAADAGVSSTHKMLSSFTQGAILTARGGLLDLERLDAIVDMIQTTSPSVLICGSIDAARRQMALDGESLLGRTIGLAHRLRAELNRISGISVLGQEMLRCRPGAGFDPTRVMVDVHGLGVTGYEAEQLLRNDHDVFVEMSDLVSVLLLVTIGDTEESINQAVAGFQALAAKHHPTRHSIDLRSSGALLFTGEPELRPREAFLAPSVRLPLSEAVGRISAESLTPYPPGIPVVIPGERLRQDVVEYLQTGVSEGMYISGLADPSFETVRVIK